MVFMVKRLIFLTCFLSFFKGVEAQKGEKSISAGPLISFPFRTSGMESDLKTGAGLEATGQYNISNKSALLVQTSFTYFGIKKGINTFAESIRLISLKGGYKYY